MTIEHPFGVEPIPEWEHFIYYDVSIGDMGSWSIHIWKREKKQRVQWKCTISPRRPFNFSKGYDTQYDAINEWMHVGDDS